MTTKQTKRLMVAGSAVACAAAVAVLLWGLLVPIGSATDSTSASGSTGDPQPTTENAANKGPTMAELRELASINLRRPLRDQEVAPPPPVPLSAKLIGTMYESSNPSQSMAVFKLSDGSEKWFKAGQTFDDPAGEVTVREVNNQKATVSYRGAEQELVAGKP